jgi:hypothetical protein
MCSRWSLIVFGALRLPPSHSRRTYLPRLRGRMRRPIEFPVMPAPCKAWSTTVNHRVALTLLAIKH